MKKLLMALTLTMALATGAPSAFADCGCPVPKDDCGCKPKCETPCNTPTCEECAERAKDFCNCRDQKREEIYCRLNLDSCQREQAMDIEDKYDSDLDCIKDKIKDDHKCLCNELNSACLDKTAVRSAEKNLRQDKRDLKAKLKCMDKDFKAILKCDQKAEYRKIKRELKYKARHAMKFCCKPCCNK